MNTIAAALTAFFHGTGTVNLLAFAGALSLVALASTAILQVAKDATPWRRWYHARRVRGWLHAGAIEAQDRLAPADSVLPLDVQEAERELVRLAADGDSNVLYGLPIERLCGQINMALQVVLDYPRANASLFAIVGSAANTSDIETMLADERLLASRNSDPMAVPTRVECGDARSRVARQFQRSVDAFQMATATEWKWSLQLASFVTCAGLAASVLLGSNTSVSIRVVLGSALFAGFLAPVAHDITVLFQKLAGGSLSRSVR